MLDVSEAVGIVLKKDSGYGFGETRLGQGWDKVVQYLWDFPAVADGIEKAVQESLLMNYSWGAVKMAQLLLQLYWWMDA
jgi:hypothetical protein